LARITTVGVSADLKERAIGVCPPWRSLVPRSNVLAKYTRSLEKGLEVPIENRMALPLLSSRKPIRIAPLIAARDLDLHGLLKGVTTFNFHPHLPHYALTTEDTKLVQVLARQPIDMSRPHPFTEAETASSIRSSGCPERKASSRHLVGRLHNIYDVVWRVESLENFWKNLASIPLTSGTQTQQRARPRSRLIYQVLRIAVCYCHLSEPHKDIDKPSEGELTIARREFEEFLWLSTFLYVLQFIAGLDTALGGPQNLYYETQVLVIPERPMPSIGCCRIPPYCRSSIHCVWSPALAS